MSVSVKNLFKRASLVALSFVLSVTSLSALGPVLFSTKASALSPAAVVTPAPTTFAFNYKDASETDQYLACGASVNSNKAKIWHESGSLNLYWTVPTGDVTGYQILTTDPSGTQTIGYQGTNPYAWLQFNQEGVYSYKVRTTSAAGVSSDSTACSIIYDHTPPAATFTQAPADGSFVSGIFHVAATATDNVALQDVAFDVRSADGLTWESGCITASTPSYSGSNNAHATISCDIDTSGLTDGTTYMLRVHASDTVGYGSVDPEAVRYFTVNRELPTSPTGLHALFQYDSTDVVNASTLNITAKPGNNNLELEWNTPVSTEWVSAYHILVTYPDGTTDLSYQGPNTNSWISTYVGFGQHGEGKYTYQVVAVNPNGESAPSAIFVLYYDTTPPTATFIVAPANGSFTKATSFHVTATANDNVGLSDVFFDVRSSDGASWVAGCQTGTFITTYTGVNNTDATLSCDIDTSGLVDGTSYIVRVHSSDNAGYGNVNSESERTFTIDRTAPVVAITAPTSTVHGSGVGVEGTIFDINLYSYSLTIKDASNTTVASQSDSTASPTANYSWDTSVFNGIYTIILQAIDKAGNSATTSQDILVDNTAPMPTITSPAGASTFGHNAIVPLVGTSDDESATLEWFVGGVSIGTGSTTNWDTTGLISGDYDVTLVATDTLGNSASTFITITIDNTAPVITFIDYAQAANVITPNLTVDDYLNYTWVPADTNPVGGASFNASTLTPSFTVTKDGTYSFILTANDSFGNSSSYVFTFSYVAPVTPETPSTFTNVGSGGSTGQTAVLGADTDQAVTGATDVKAPATSSTNGNGNIFGLAWYWWILIIAAIVALGWWLIAALRRRNQDEE